MDAAPAAPSSSPPTAHSRPERWSKKAGLSFDMLLYMRALHERYGTDTDAMFADIKLNYLQFTKKRLADMLALYLKKHEQLEIEERLGTLEEIDPDKDCEREIADVDRILDGIDLGDVSTDDELFDQLVEEFNITDALPEGALESDDAMDEAPDGAEPEAPADDAPQAKEACAKPPRRPRSDRKRK